jgi:hypothetical protein
MELALNVGWMALAAVMCWLWMRYAPRKGPGRWAEFVSLALVLLTMFAVITMYDDMAMAQNPAETRCFQREDDLGSHAHASLHPVVTAVPTHSAEVRFNTIRLAAPGGLLNPTVKDPVLSSIQNRPPPAA